MELIAQGLLEVRPGLGTVVSALPGSTAAERAGLLKREVEQIVVEAKKLGLSLEEVNDAIVGHWERLDGGSKGAREGRSAMAVPGRRRS